MTQSGNKVVESKGWVILFLMVLVVGCVTRTVPPTTAVSILTPAVTAAPTRGLAPTPGDMGDDVAGRLYVRRAISPPVIDGHVDVVWTAAEMLRLPLTWGMGGAESALDVELRALRTNEAIFFLARWVGEPPNGKENTVFNKLTLHWRIPDAAARRLDCAVACHTAFADGHGRFVFANSETIPQGSAESLSVAGNWRAGIWTLEWSRSLANDNFFDLQFDDLDRTYLFFVKVFEHVEGRPDPVSPLHLLVFDD